MSEYMAGKWQTNGKVGADDKGSEDMISCYCPKLDLTVRSRLEARRNDRFKAAFLLPIQRKGGKQMAKKDESKRNRWAAVSQKLCNGFHMTAVTCYMMVLFAQPAAAADTMWTRFSTIIEDVYGQLVGISTIVAVTAAAVALLVRMISRNERAVAEATSWLKRIVVTWIVLNTLGFVVAYLQPLIQGGQYTP